MNTRQDWPLGPALRSHREACGLSVKAAARRTNKRVSDGRWYQLESGYQQIKGQLIPISTTPATVAAAATAVEWDIAEALELAGFDPIDLPSPEKRSLLKEASDAELVAEIADRLARRQRGLEGGVGISNESEDVPFGRGFRSTPPPEDEARMSGNQ